MASEVQSVVKSIEAKEKEQQAVLNRVNYKHSPDSMTVKQLQKELKTRGLSIVGMACLSGALK